MDQLKLIRERLAKAKKPIFFFDDDVDGLASYICLRTFTQKGKGVIVKSSPLLKQEYCAVVDSYKPDLVVILDKPMVSPEFFEEIHVPVIWIDHHLPQEVPDFVTYFNPRIADDADNRCTSYWAYKIAQEREWLAVCGSVSDWQITDIVSAFSKKHPQFIDPNITDPAHALFSSVIGKIVKMLTFNLKGNSTQVKKSIKCIEEIEDINELLHPSTESAKHLVDRFKEMSEEYNSILSSVHVTDSPIVYFEYEPKKVSVTTELSNELLFLHPGKVIIIARRKNNEYKCSLRAANRDLPPIIEKALVGLIGYGGGHMHACGACVAASDFETFKERLEEMLLDR